jgi:hemerythrin
VNVLTLIQWAADLVIGIETVDREHRSLIDAINRVQTAVDDAYDSNIVLPLVVRTAKEAQSHFASEETAMVRAGYPGATLHALKHQHMMDQILAFISRYARDTSTLNQHWLNFFRDTMTNHIQNEDAIFGRWMLEHASDKFAQPAEISNDI